ncbi:MAG: aminotransferase class I/II-fold pyridoxal phosphate-dependent enzyme [Lachnospiraceae bacterium]|nr:aminotransferase class I/II-fold pyridoxal phosphate-dependent enzyme [Lachnospiraceae bacterium]
MKNIYENLGKEELLKICADLRKQYEDYQALGLKLDISRGKPSPEQLALSMPMLDTMHSDADYLSEDGLDTRNYGALTGIPEAKRLMADVMETRPENVIIFCDSSLNIMYDLITKSWTHGVMGSTPWYQLPEVKFLCPVPGYDRHFAITEYFGIQMINIPMLETGPDMDLVEKYVSEDPSVKGIWCVPKYSNPTGTVYSEETCFRFARLKPAAEDFRIYWDNAYNVHHLDVSRPRVIPELIEECRLAGNPDMVYKFGSFSKITFPGSSIAALACSPANIADVVSQMKIQTIGHSKINQLRHARFFVDRIGVINHMRKHAAIVKPKFELVQEVLKEQLGGTGLGSWTNPEGGYFLSFDTLPGCAKKVVKMMKEAGVVMTGAGATYPYGKDPDDSNIRIAPTFAELPEIRQAFEVFGCVVKLVSAEQALQALG